MTTTKTSKKETFIAAYQNLPTTASQTRKDKIAYLANVADLSLAAAATYFQNVKSGRWALWDNVPANPVEMIDISGMTGAQLVELFNKHVSADKQVKKFRTLADGIRRTQAVLAA
jgi:hypothetical protein